MFAASAAVADCLVCDEVVELDGIRARCFQQDYGKFLERAERSKTGNAEVDLGTCAGDDGTEQRGLDKFPSLDPLDAGTESVRSPLRSVYVLDKPAIVCLKRLLDDYRGLIDPKVQFDLLEQCRP
ncbi:hypothetical protein [Aureimonas leprariae]|nr:hypothetical protein [Aureimonas leprariae]